MAEFPVAVITDEFSQDLEQVCKTAADLGVPGLEIRTAWDKNIVDMTDDEVRDIRRLADASRLQVISIASPVYKCTHPSSGDIDHRFEQDAFQSAHTWEDQPRILARAVQIARMLGAQILRVFSFWRSVEPTHMHDAIVDALREAVQAASPAGVHIGLENEHACNLATGAEVAPVLKAVPEQAFGVVWDPANAYVSGVKPFPDDYRNLPPDRILHVHAKDGVMHDDRMEWDEVGRGKVNWKGQLEALNKDGYQGMISLETHWGGPGGDKFQGSVQCVKALQKLIDKA